MDISFLLIAYAISLLLQISLLTYVWTSKIRTPFLLTFIVLFFVTNSVQFLVLRIDNAFILEVFVRLFFTVFALLIACFLSYAIHMRSIMVSEFMKQFERSMWLLAFCIGILSLVTNEILTGYRSLSYSITAIEGSSYWLCLVHGFFATFAAVAILIQEWMSLRYENQRTRCLFVLAGYLSYTFCLTVVIVLLRYGFEINVPMIFPFISTLCLCFIVYGESKYRKITTVNETPEQNESAGYDELNSIFTKYREQTYSFNEALEKLDYLLLTHAYDKHNGNIVKTAEAMGLGRSTLYKKIRKHNLK